MRAIGNHKFLLLFLMLSMAALGGCQTSGFSAAGQQHNTREEAMAAHQAYVNRVIASIKPTNTPIGGVIEVFAPSETGFLQRAPQPNTTNEEDLRTNAWGNSLLRDMMVESLRRKAIFDEVVLREYDSLDRPSMKDGHFGVWHRLVSRADQVWLFLADNEADPRKILIDHSVPHGAQRTENWIEAVGGAAASVNGGASTRSIKNHGIRDRKLPKAKRTVD